jgi:hypothetical protein
MMGVAKRLRERNEASLARPVARTRADAARFAIASTIMEGGEVAPETERLLADWVDGKLEDDEVMAKVLEGFGPSA